MRVETGDPSLIRTRKCKERVTGRVLDVSELSSPESPRERR